MICINIPQKNNVRKKKSTLGIYEDKCMNKYVMVIKNSKKRTDVYAYK